MATLGDLVVNLTAKNLDLQRKLKQAQGDMQRTGASAQQMSKKVGISTGQMTANMQNLSFGVQDVASVMGAGGSLGRGMSAMANNLGTVAAQAGPIAGILVGVGLSAGGALVDGMMSASNAEATFAQKTDLLSGKLRDLLGVLGELKESATADVGFLKFTEQQLPAIDSSEALKSAISSRITDLKGNKIQRRAVESQLRGIGQQFGVNKVDTLTGKITEKGKAFDSNFAKLEESEQKRLVERVVALNKELEALTASTSQTQKELAALHAETDRVTASEQARRDAEEQKKEAERIRKEGIENKQQGDRDFAKLDSLLSQASPVEAFRQKLRELDDLDSRIAIEPEDYDLIASNILKSSSSRLASQKSDRVADPQLLSGLQKNSKEQLDRILKAGMPKGSDPQKKLTATAQKQLDTMKQMLAEAKKARETSKTEVVIGAIP